jgi:hypothetical protein
MKQSALEGSPLLHNVGNIASCADLLNILQRLHIQQKSRDDIIFIKHKKKL